MVAHRRDRRHFSVPSQQYLGDLGHAAANSLPWFAVGAALLALPIVFLAWRRTRRIRAA